MKIVNHSSDKAEDVAAAAQDRGASYRRVIGWSACALLCMQIAWLLIVPAFYGMDEVDHAYRATSVAEGQWEAGSRAPIDGRGQLLPVPEHMVDAAHDICSELTYIGRDNCVPRDPADSDGLVTVASAAATYNPSYYLVVGLAAKPFEGSHALMAMRVATALICDALLLWALALMLRTTRNAWPLVGLSLVCTPIFLYSTTSAAPNAVGFCGGVLLWAALMSLPNRESTRPVSNLSGLVVGSTCVMATHSTGVMWVFLILACGVPLWIPRFKNLIRFHRRSTLVAGTLVGLAGITSVLWILLSDTNDPRAENADLGAAPPQLLAHMPAIWVLQGIATLRFRDQAAPMAVYFIGLAAIGWFLVTVLRGSPRRSRVVMTAIFGVSIAVPVVATWYAYPYVGNAWQGRYGAPLYVGIFIVAVFVARFRSVPTPVMALLYSLAFGVMHALTLYGLLDYFVDAEIVSGWQISRIVVLATGSSAATLLWLAAFRAGGVRSD